MAEDEGAVASAKEGISKKIGPLPAWGWAVVVIGGFLLYKKFAGGSSTSPNGPAGVTQPTTLTGGYDNAGADSYLQNLLASQQTTTSPVTQLTTQVGKLIGSGYSALSPNQVITTSQGSFEWVTNPSSAAALQSNGEQLF